VPGVTTATTLSAPADRVMLGHITGIYGLKGWVKVHSDTSPRENIVTYRTWWVGQGDHWQTVKVLDGRAQGKTIVASLDGVQSPEQASALIGAGIAVSRGELPQPAEGEYYWADLIGMQVRTVDDVLIGPVDRLFETGANDVMVITDERVAQTPREVLVPWLVPDVITDVNMESRVITVDWDPDF
jgi:16S rRNA processing protein RimM